MISQERLKLEVKLYYSMLIGSPICHVDLAQQRMTLSDLEWPFHALHTVSVVAELLVYLLTLYNVLVFIRYYCIVKTSTTLTPIATILSTEKLADLCHMFF